MLLTRPAWRHPYAEQVVWHDLLEFAEFFLFLLAAIGRRHRHTGTVGLLPAPDSGLPTLAIDCIEPRLVGLELFPAGAYHPQRRPVAR